MEKGVAVNGLLPVIGLGRSLGCYLVTAGLVVVCSHSLVPDCVGQVQYEGTAAEKDSLKRFLGGYLSHHPGLTAGTADSTTYLSAFVDLRDDGTREAIVYLTSPVWCGTGGCSMLILVPEGSSYRKVGGIPAVNPPIRVLATKSNGWHDITVWTSGGGIL